MLYDRDSDDSSSEGGFSDHHVAMGIANDKCGEDDRYSLDSDLFTNASNDEMDGTGLDGNFNPAGLRITAGARVGIDTDDESDDDGEHGLYHQDKDIAYRGMGDRGMMRGGGASISSGSFSSGNSSDDDIDVNMRGNGKNQTWLRDDQDLDAEMPVGTARAGLVVDAGNSSKMDAEDIASARKEADKVAKEQDSKVKESIAKNKSRALVEEALAKARASKDPRAKLHFERRAEMLAKGTDTGKKVIVKGVLQDKRSGQVLAPSVRAKGRSALKSGLNAELRQGVREVTTARAQETARANEESRRMYSGEHQHEVKKAVGRVRKFVAGNIKTIKDTAGRLKTGRQEREAEVVAGQKAEQKHYTEMKINKFFASKGLARLRQATRESKLKKILLNEKASVITRFIRLAVAKGVLERARAQQLDADLKALAKGRNISDDEDAETVTRAGGVTVASDPRGSVFTGVLSTAMAGGGGGGASASASAGAPVGQLLNAEQVGRIAGEGGFVHKGVNAVVMNGNRIMVNGEKLTSNRVNLPVIMELIANFPANKKQHKALWTALNKAKSMIDGGKGNGKAQSTIVLAVPPPPKGRKLKRGGGGGGGGGVTEE